MRVQKGKHAKEKQEKDFVRQERHSDGGIVRNAEGALLLAPD